MMRSRGYMQHLNIGKRGVLVLVLSAFVWRLGAQTGAVTGGVGAGVTDSAAVQLGRAIDRDDDDQRQNRLSHILDENSFISRMAENCPPLKDPAFRRGFMETFPPNLPKIGASLASAANGGS